MTKTFKHILEATERPTYAKLKWQSGAERDKAFAKMLRHYPNTKQAWQGFTYKKVGADEIDMNITTMVTNSVANLKRYDLGNYKVVTMREEVPANATGTAVAGTGDDSSTVLVKKRKELQKRLLRRFAIKETLDKILPDPVEKEDVITTRKKQLKELAKNRNV